MHVISHLKPFLVYHNVVHVSIQVLFGVYARMYIHYGIACIICVMYVHWCVCACNICSLPGCATADMDAFYLIDYDGEV